VNSIRRHRIQRILFWDNGLDGSFGDNGFDGLDKDIDNEINGLDGDTVDDSRQRKKGNETNGAFVVTSLDHETDSRLNLSDGLTDNAQNM
jgi:hypothetical protein